MTMPFKVAFNKNFDFKDYICGLKFTQVSIYSCLAIHGSYWLLSTENSQKKYWS